MCSRRAGPPDAAWLLAMWRWRSPSRRDPRCAGAATQVVESHDPDGALAAVTVALVGLVGLDDVRLRHGHRVADDARVAVRDRVARCSRPAAVTTVDDDTLLVAVPSDRWTNELLRRIAGAVDRPLLVHGHRVKVAVAIGVATGAAPDATRVIARAGANLRAALARR